MPETHCIVFCPDTRSGQRCRAASVLDRQAADGRWAVAPAMEQERAFARAPTRELAILAPCFLRELVFGAGKRPYRAGPLCLDSCLSSHESHKTAASKLPYRRRMPCWRVSARYRCCKHHGRCSFGAKRGGHADGSREVRPSLLESRARTESKWCTGWRCKC